MTVFRNVVFAAAAAGLLAGILLAALQTYATVPLILQAETFEGAASHDHGAAPAEASPGEAVPADAVASSLSEEEEAWGEMAEAPSQKPQHNAPKRAPPPPPNQPNLTSMQHEKNSINEPTKSSNNANPTVSETLEDIQKKK